MPAMHTEEFKVRYTECDAYGHVNNAHYFRYMQEAAFGATAAVGYPYQQYEEMQRLWLARETAINYLLPLAYGDRFQIRTWVEDFRRSRSRRRYEISLIESGEMVAESNTDWVYIDSSTGRLAPIPEKMIESFYPEGLPEESPRRERFPKAPPPPESLYEMWRRVEFRDIDLAGHVNNAVYLSYGEDCGMNLCFDFGWPEERMREEGFGIIVRGHRIEYKAPAVMHDDLLISTYLYNVRNAQATRYYQFRRASDGLLLAHTHTRYVWSDINTGKPIRIPAHFLEDFKQNIVAR